eukprot:TRINITY_DN4828_c1_g3_i3.p1 TRINITY_DN4828_c1_g3~~TRINITY_DN4828_c1_g3_i3.p1  ORF type:complete len:885 (+),score=154.29 TRINITY_DN4828_c1_g3_i3:80-2734(+)
MGCAAGVLSSASGRAARRETVRQPARAFSDSGTYGCTHVPAVIPQPSSLQVPQDKERQGGGLDGRSDYQSFSDWREGDSTERQCASSSSDILFAKLDSLQNKCRELPGLADCETGTPGVQTCSSATQLTVHTSVHSCSSSHLGATLSEQDKHTQHLANAEALESCPLEGVYRVPDFRETDIGAPPGKQAVWQANCDGYRSSDLPDCFFDRDATAETASCATTEMQFLGSIVHALHTPEHSYDSSQLGTTPSAQDTTSPNSASVEEWISCAPDGVWPNGLDTKCLPDGHLAHSESLETVVSGPQQSARSIDDVDEPITERPGTLHSAARLHMVMRELRQRKSLGPPAGCWEPGSGHGQRMLSRSQTMMSMPASCVTLSSAERANEESRESAEERSDVQDTGAPVRDTTCLSEASSQPPAGVCRHEPAQMLGSSVEIQHLEDVTGAAAAAAVLPVTFFLEELQAMKVADLKDLLRERNLLLSGKKADLIERLLNPEGQQRRQRQRPKLPILIRALPLHLRPVLFTQNGWPATSADALGKLQATNAKVLGKSGMQAMQCLREISELDGALDGFVSPLKRYAREGRIHAFFNLNTETGRLSSTNPNLQNQPTGRRLSVRDAFVAAPGKVLIDADYAQLELRVVAHLAGCKPMAEALNSGGDIHSKTAALMFAEVREAIERGEVTVDERPQEPGQEPVLPSVKEKFKALRDKAKTLNFSVLYGKTTFGLAKDWGMTQSEATMFIKRWFEAFPEIRKWQLEMEFEATSDAGCVRTLLGRSRKLRGTQSADRKDLAAALRMAINTPVQGGAADIVTLAMLKLHNSEKLQMLGFELVHQIHDEVLLEGPEENQEEAKAEVVRLMEDPLPFPLLARLAVSVRTGRTWHEGKGA